MWKLLICFILLTIATETRAQTPAASLFITLSDIQSIKLNDSPEQKKTGNSSDSVKNSEFEILNPEGSQVVWYDSILMPGDLTSKDLAASSLSAPFGSLYPNISKTRPIGPDSSGTEKSSQNVILKVCQIVPR